MRHLTLPVLLLCALPPAAIAAEPESLSAATVDAMMEGLGGSRSLGREAALFRAFTAGAPAQQPAGAGSFTGLGGGTGLKADALGRQYATLPSAGFAAPTTAPRAPAIPPADLDYQPVDLTGDGKSDGWIADSNGDGAFDVVLYDADGDGIAELIVYDTDFNGVADAKLVLGVELEGQTVNLYAFDVEQDGSFDLIGVDYDRDGTVDEMVPA